MRFARRLVLLPLLSLLAACSPTTPLFVAQVTTGEVAEYKQMKSNRMTAAIEEEGDLLTYSAMAIRDNRSAEAEKLYLTGYDNSRYSAEVRGISLYQIGLIYMSRYNDQRDDAKATDYFQRVVREFPGTHAAEHAQARLLAMRQRAREPVQKSARELLATWKPQQNLDLYKTSLDPDMTLLRADGPLPLALKPMHDAAGTHYGDPKNGWQHWTSGRLDVIDVPGDHLVLMKEPYVETVAAEIAALLEPSTSSERTRP